MAEKQVLTIQEINAEKRAAQCSSELRELLLKYQCILDPCFTFSSAGIAADIKVKAK